MYERYFGFQAKPFAITPDPAFLFPTRQHALALTMLEYGMESHSAFALLTGEIGSGKTTLVRRLIRDLGNRVVVGLVSHTHSRFKSLHPWAISSLGIVPADDSDIALYEALVDFCVRTYANGRRTLLIFDEAQNLSMAALEELRLLSNVNSETDVILQILLVGQPELRDKLSKPKLRQFAQRIAVDCHLRALDPGESLAYIRHRLTVAGGDPRLFSVDAVRVVHASTHGVPRLINQLCDFALLYAFSDGSKLIDAPLIEQLVRDRGNGVAMPAATVLGPVAVTRKPAARTL